MEYIFATTLFLSIGALIVGLIKPNLVIKWKKEATRKDVLKVYSGLIVVSFIMVGIFAPSVKKKEVTQEAKQATTIKKSSQNKGFSINSIDVSNFSYTMNGKQAVSIQLIQDKNSYIDITIEKNVIKNGYNYDSSKHNNTKYPVEITANINGKIYNFYNNLNVLKMKILEYNKNTKQATINIDTVLNSINNRDDIAELLNIEIKIEKDNFDLLKKNLTKVEQVKTVDKPIAPSTKKIDVVLNEIVQNDNGKITIKGTTNLPNNTKILVYISSDLYSASDSIDVLNGKFISTTFTNKNKPLFNGKYEISIRTKSYKEQSKDVQHLMGKDGINLIGKLIIKNEYFHDNNLHYKKSYTIDNSIDRKEIVSITSTQLKQVIKSLKDNYYIVASGFDNAKLNKFKMCWNDRSCEVYADRVQIQAIYKKIQVLTSSRVTPLYYQQICSATMIALTGANKELIEQSMPQYFNYASQNGRSRWEVLGIELTISADSQGLLGCSFYKQ